MNHSFQLLDITETENRSEVGWFFRRESDKIDEMDQAGTPLLFDDDRWGQCTEAIVVRKAGKIIGIVTLAPDGIDNSKRPTIDTLYVQKQHRKKGMGYALFEQGIRRLIECIGNKTIYRVLPQVKPTTLSKLPIRAIDFKNSEENSQHGKMVKLVKRMIDLQSKLASTKMPHTKTTIQRQIDATDRQINKLVYKLYDLTDDEIEIVESSTAQK